MGMFDFLKAKKNTASIAKDRLRIIIAQERTNRAGPDYLPLLQRALLEVIRKSVSVAAAAVKVDVVKDGEHRSEARRVGQECVSTCRSLREPYGDKKKKQ